MLTQAQKEAAQLYRWEDSSLRQVWRITQLLVKIKKVGEAPRDIKNEGWSE